LPSSNIKIKIYRTVILLVVLYGYETWWLTLREKHRLRFFENRVLGRLFRPKRMSYQGSVKNYIVRRLMTCVLHPV
jgi:hypothetical protein